MDKESFMSRLTPSVVMMLRARKAAGASLSELAREYRVHPSTISRAIRRKTWRRVN
jgi:IS30 family transposase